MNIKEELKATKEKWIAIGQRLGELKQESDNLQVQGRQLEGRYHLLEQLLAEEEAKEKKDEAQPKN